MQRDREGFVGSGTNGMLWEGRRGVLVRDAEGEGKGVKSGMWDAERERGLWGGG